jgi:Family of unknown function (DUF6152)
MNLNKAILAVVMVTGAALPVLAHHAFASEFDEKRPVKLEGKVTRVELINPHSWIHIDVEDGGKTTEWMIEGGSPNSLFRNGFTKTSLAIGTVIVVDGYQAKDGANRAVGKDLTFKDGKRLFLGGSAPGANGPTAK